MPSEVKSVVTIISEDCNFIISLKKAIGPDNKFTARGMKIEESINKTSSDECVYVIEVMLHEDIGFALKRARSTVEEILAVIKTLNNVLFTIKRSKEFTIGNA